MTRSAPSWTTFNAGELSPLIDGRTDQEKYFAGCKKLCNYIPTVQGPASRRGGTRYLGSTRSNLRAWFMTFEFNQAQSYVLELTDLKMRFWVNRGELLSGMSPYEIATPWSAVNLVTEEDTLALRSVQSGDVMWACHSSGAVAPQKLSRIGATNWTLVNAPFDSGPFEDVDPTSTVTVTASGTTGVITLTASSAIFTTDDIGTSFYVEQKDGANIKSWGANKNSTVGDKRRWAGNYYVTTQNGGGATPGTGNNPPIHTEGVFWDGDGVTDVPNDGLGVLGAEWRYLHSGYGIIAITAVGGGGTTATGTVLLLNGVSQLPDAIVSPGTTRWAKSLFSALRGWPTGVTFFRERLCYVRGRDLAMSVVGAPDDFSSKDGPDATVETAVKLRLRSDQVDSIRWVTQSSSLLLGSARSEMSIQEQTTQKVFASDNASATPQTKYGSRLLEPLTAGNAVLFVQRAGRKLRELIYDYASDKYKADDLTVLSEHILNAGVVDMDFQQEPDSIVWCTLADGSLAALTYNRERGVVAWVPHKIGGPDAFVESVACISSPDGRRDDVWLSVARTINGSTVRYVEVLEDNHLADTDPADGFYGDAGITYAGAATTTIAGLGHLEGATVQVLADGSAHADRVVTGGQITLNRAASKVQIGFDSPAQLQTMRAEANLPDGTAQTRMKSIAQVFLRLNNTIGGQYGPTFDRLDPIPGLDPRAAIGTPPALFSGDKECDFPADYNTDGYICLQSSPMLPMTIIMVTARMEIND